MAGVPEYLSGGPFGLSQCGACGACAACALCTLCGPSPTALAWWAAGEGVYFLLHLATEVDPS